MSFNIHISSSGFAIEYILQMNKRVEIWGFEHALAWELRNRGLG
jgi:hypothetical protein